MRILMFLTPAVCLLLTACGATVRSQNSDPAPDAIILDVAEASQDAAARPPAFSGPVPGSPEDFIITAGERVYFDVNKYNLDIEDRAILQRQAAWLTTYPTVRILISGNADERGTREYNLALGARRAASVKEYLMSAGVEVDRIETISYGKERPLDPQSNASAWSINRNVQTRIVGGYIGG